MEQQRPLDFVWTDVPASAGGAAFQTEKEPSLKHFTERHDMTMMLQDRSDSVTVRLKKLLRAAEKKTDLEKSVQCCSFFLCRLADGSPSLREYADTALRYYEIPNDLRAFKAGATIQKASIKFQRQRQIFQREFPEWETFAEHLLVNHLFFSDENDPKLLSVIYALLLFLAMAWTAGHKGRDALIDVCAATFRFIEHTAFQWNAEILLNELGMKNSADIAEIL